MQRHTAAGDAWRRPVVLAVHGAGSPCCSADLLGRRARTFGPSIIVVRASFGTWLVWVSARWLPQWQQAELSPMAALPRLQEAELKKV
jgi:hypothetical protein